MKTKLILFALIAAMAFTSCESDDSEDNVQETKTYLMTRYTYDSKVGTETKTFTYNDDNKVIKITSVYKDNTSTYDLDYDSQGRVIKIYKNDEAQYEFQYQTGKVIEKWNYNMTGYWEETTYLVNSNGKITKRGTESDISYSTYIWEDDNMKSNTYNGSSSSTTTYRYDTDIKNPGYDQYLLQHPMWESKNVCDSKTFNDGDIANYTLSYNEAGYLTRRVTINEYLGTITETFSYVEITE